jgi:membrane-bound metal-dependent hydrolase YbcI (DUF457 family)
MFIGHAAAGLGSKRAASATNLGLLLGAAWLLDLIWPLFLLIGIEHVDIGPRSGSPFLTLEFTHYPWSHSLVMTIVWSVLAGAIYWAFTKNRAGALTIAALVTSHWVLDYVTHRPDLPLWPGGPKVGLGLWHSPAGTIVVEVLLFAAGVAIFVRTKRPSLAFWTLIAFLMVAYVANIVGPPPPNVRALAIGALAGYLLPLWGWWADRRP